MSTHTAHGFGSRPYDTRNSDFCQMRCGCNACASPALPVRIFVFRFSKGTNTFAHKHTHTHILRCSAFVGITRDVGHMEENRFMHISCYCCCCRRRCYECYCCCCRRRCCRCARTALWITHRTAQLCTAQHTIDNWRFVRGFVVLAVRAFGDRMRSAGPMDNSVLF